MAKPTGDFGNYSDPLSDPRRPEPGQVFDSIETVRKRRELHQHAARVRPSLGTSIIYSLLSLLLVVALWFFVNPLVGSIVLAALIVIALINAFRH